MMDNVIVALLIAVLSGQGITVIVPLIIRRRNNKTEGLVQSEGGGMVCVYHKDIQEKLARIDEGVTSLNRRQVKEGD